MEDLAVFTTLNHSGYLGKNFIEIKKKKNYVIFRLRVGLYSEKLLQRSCLRPRAAFLRPRYSFSLYGPPSRQTTYIDTMLSELGPKSVFSDVVRGKLSVCGSPFHFSHSFPRH